MVGRKFLILDCPSLVTPVLWSSQSCGRSQSCGPSLVCRCCVPRVVVASPSVRKRAEAVSEDSDYWVSSVVGRL